MAYIVKSDYTAFTTTVISDSDFNLISERASDIIDVITFKIGRASCRERV